MKDDEVTMIDKIRISKSKIEILWLFLLLCIFFMVMLVLGGVQYVFCLDKNPDVTIVECFRWTKK